MENENLKDQQSAVHDTYEDAQKQIKFSLLSKGSDFIIRFYNSDIDLDIPDTEESAKRLFKLAKESVYNSSNEDDVITIIDEEMARSGIRKTIEKGTIV